MKNETPNKWSPEVNTLFGQLVPKDVRHSFTGEQLCWIKWFSESYHKSKEEVNKELLEALGEAVIGVEWTIENFPNDDHKADFEKLEEWKKLIKKAKGS